MYMNLLLKSQIFFLIEHRITSDSLCFKSQANDKRTHQHHSNQEETARKKECSIGRTHHVIGAETKAGFCEQLVFWWLAHPCFIECNCMALEFRN